MERPKETEGKIWCDASDLALGVIVEIGGVIVEDAAWLRKPDDFNHINVAELEAALRGVNIGVQWGLKTMTVVTDSATVCGWIKSTVSEDKRVRTKGAAEVLVVLKTLMEELELRIEVVYVSGNANKADALTRVKSDWLKMELLEKPVNVAAVGVGVRGLHNQHHFGVERSWYLARLVDPMVTKAEVKEVVRECERCQSIDPANATQEAGELRVEKVWVRLAIDLTYYRGLPYLSMVDCGPARFAIWREMKSEGSLAICKELEQVFLERGPVEEILMDNAMTFRLREMEELLMKWNATPFYRAAYRPGGNGIVERHHRTIKAMSERGQVAPPEAVFWYNLWPRNDQQEATVPRRSVHCYKWRHPSEKPVRREKQEERATVRVGDEVWVKPPTAKCTEEWSRGLITDINSSKNVEVDGVTRHILDIRPVTMEKQAEHRYPRQQRRDPVWTQDYEM